MKILTIGGATRDIFIEHDIMATKLHDISYLMLPEGKKVEVSAIHYATGGGATNSAVSFKRLGFEVESFFKVGTDYEAEIIIKELASEGVSTHHAQQTNLASTGTSFMLPSPNGDRAILVYRGANLLLATPDIPKNLLAGADHLYITSLSGNASELLPYLVAQAKTNNSLVACNPGTSQLTARVDTLEQALEHIDILILNSYEASLLWQKICPSSTSGRTVEENQTLKKSKTNSLSLPSNNPNPFALRCSKGVIDSSLYEYFKTILARGPRIAVVTDGANGVFVCDGSKMYYHPSIPCKPTSSVGAGDAFGSTFVAYLAQSKPIEEAIQAGIINAASVLMHLDAKAGLLTKEKIEQQRKNLDPSLLQVFDF